MNAEVLLYLKLDLVNGEARAKDVVEYLHRKGKVSAISTIYKRFRSDLQTDLSANIELVIRHESEMLIEEYVEHLTKLEAIGELAGKRNHLRIELLNYGSTVSMTPKMTLPSPLLLTDHLVRKCCAEVWGEFVHPIMKKNLAEMAAEVRLESDTEFFRQGASLVNQLKSKERSK